MPPANKILDVSCLKLGQRLGEHCTMPAGLLAATLGDCEAGCWAARKLTCPAQHQVPQ